MDEVIPAMQGILFWLNAECCFFFLCLLFSCKHHIKTPVSCIHLSLLDTKQTGLLGINSENKEMKMNVRDGKRVLFWNANGVCFILRFYFDVSEPSFFFLHQLQSFKNTGPILFQIRPTNFLIQV